jgi:hypothetical protein
MAWIATHTLAAINAALVADGGNKFRGLQGQVLPHIADAYRTDEGADHRRTHLGASVIGGDCDRAIYYGWRWAPKRAPQGSKGEPSDVAHARMIRLWNRGHLEEGRFIALLLMIGVAVYQQDENGNQFRISEFGGHFGGSGDGIALNVPDLPPGVYCLIEAKTHGEKSFDKLKANGVEFAKPAHFVQMQKYLGGFGLLYALYIAVNKNTDELYMEIVQYNGNVDAEFTRRAERIIFATEPPRRLVGASPGYFKCRFCDHLDMCFGGAKPDVSCRTCRYGVPRIDGTWHCENMVSPRGVLDKDAQKAGCENWIDGISD